ncbi:MAG: hypothetical protein PHD32_09690 [Eubacteriales bacterium]|nr:hypothetical protein [Eubacteriales bacterium]
MYSQDELNEAEKQVGRFITWYVVAAVVFVALFALCCIFRWPYVLYPLLVVFPAGSVFLWDLYGRRMIHWRDFLRDMVHTSARERQGILGEIEAQPVDKRGLEYQRLHVLSGDKQEDDKVQGRIFYYELSRPALPARVGDRIAFATCDRFIKEITVLEEKA